MNETHDPALTSWVESAQAEGSDFRIQNLPFAVFRRRGSDELWRGGVAIGDGIVDLHAAAPLLGDVARVAAADTLNAFMALGPGAWSSLRLALSRGLRTSSSQQTELAACLVPQADAEYRVPARIGDYTDFYTSVHHATNIGRQFRPDHPLLPNYKWVPIGYHGRSSSIAVSPHSFRRPVGQTLPTGATEPVVGASKRLDIELELGVFIGGGNESGASIPIADAESHVFGLVLFNDWSARDLQSWEYQPLGPFLSKNFASTISPWIVTMEALAPYRVAFERASGDPQPLPYLDSAANRAGGAFDVKLQVDLVTPGAQLTLARTSYRHAYWTIAQLVAHHTVNGCNLQPGDLLGTGTLSGPTAGEAGSLLELTQGGKSPVALPGGQTRTYLEDGDSIVLRGWCERSGAARIGFGECRGTVLPAREIAR
jgi:fumarylacetoacetase